MALGDVAVATYRFVVHAEVRSVHVHRRFRTPNVWTTRAGRWQIVATHTALILEPKHAAALFAE